ncbi:MAG TPA: lipoyl(octanoyl) transferase LipB [Candidatus Acidoferrales bacterium]|jgi:lipoyl(octanoyl) transferase
MNECLVVDLGLIGYERAWDLQKRIVAARKLALIPDVLLLCEHPHVITMGRNGRAEHLLASDSVLRARGVEFRATNRGGDITYHGPGQIVAYPILNLAEIRSDVGWYVRQLEEAMIRTSAEYGITAGRREGRTGIWVKVATEAGITDEEKLGAIGVHISRWVTSHGLAYNVSTDLRFFDLIVPCGIAGKRATSLKRLLNHEVEMNEAKPRLVQHLGECFGRTMRAISPAELEIALAAQETSVAVA